MVKFKKLDLVKVNSPEEARKVNEEFHKQGWSWSKISSGTVHSLPYSASAGKFPKYIGIYSDGDIFCRQDSDNTDKDFNVMDYKDLEIFTPQRGDKVLVWDKGDISKGERIFLCVIEGSVSPIQVVYNGWEEAFFSQEPFQTVDYEFMEPMPKETTITKQEVADLLKVDVETLSIVDEELEAKERAAEIRKLLGEFRNYYSFQSDLYKALCKTRDNSK